MNLVEALEKKKAIWIVIEDRLDTLSDNIYDQEELSSILIEIDSLVDQFYSLERLIQKNYESTKVSSTESIADVLSYLDGLAKKIDVLKHLLLELHKNKINTGVTSDIDVDSLLQSIRQYESMQSALLKKVKDVCFCSSLDA